VNKILGPKTVNRGALQTPECGTDKNVCGPTYIRFVHTARLLHARSTAVRTTPIENNAEKI